MIVKSEKRQKVLEKMKKILAHTGEGGVDVNEMANANKLLKRLTDDYGVSIEEIRDIGDKETLTSRIEVDTFHSHPRKWIGSLASELAHFYECRCIKIEGKFCFIGFDLDCHFAAEVFGRLYTLISRMSRMQSVNLNDFSFGVVVSLRERLDEIKKNRMSSDINALVVVKKNVVDEQVEKMFPNLRKGSRAKYYYSDDFYKGIEYGKTIEIFKSVKEE